MIEGNVEIKDCEYDVGEVNLINWENQSIGPGAVWVFWGFGYPKIRNFFLKFFETFLILSIPWRLYKSNVSKLEEGKYFDFVALICFNELGMNMMLISFYLMEVWIN